VSNFQVIAKHFVVGYFERANTRSLYFALLQLKQVIFPRIGNGC
jgi:hypothetical protein